MQQVITLTCHARTHVLAIPFYQKYTEDTVCLKSQEKPSIQEHRRVDFQQSKMAVKKFAP